MNEFVGAGGAFFFGNLMLCNIDCMRQKCYRDGCVGVQQSRQQGCVDWLTPVPCDLGSADVF